MFPEGSLSKDAPAISRDAGNYMKRDLVLIWGICQTQGINALGYRIWPTNKLLRRRAIVMFRRDMRRLIRGGEEGWAGTDQVTDKVKAFVAHAKYGDTWRLRKKLFSTGCF